MSGVHAKYSGSNAHRFLRCPGQPRLAAQVPELPAVDDYAAEGEQAHALLAKCLTGGHYGPHDPLEMRSAIDAVIGFLTDLKTQYPDLIVLSEQFGLFPQNVVPADQASGTADVIAYSLSAQVVYVIDFKYGVGVTVDVEDNEQIKFYAAIAAWRTAFKTLYGVIIQPRSFRGGEPRVVEIDAFDLIDFVSEIETGIARCEHPTAELIPGEHCAFCPAGGICPARESQSLAVISPDGRPVDALDPLMLPQPVDLSPQRLGDIMAMKGQVIGWLNDVAKYSFQIAMSGRHVPGQKIVEAKARRRWIDDAEKLPTRLAVVTETHPHDWRTEPALIPMTDAEKRVVAAFKVQGRTAAEAKECFSQFVTKESSGELSLVSTDDPRPAYNRATQDFAGVVPAQLGD